MQSNFVKHIIVVAKKKPVGIVTERDINYYLENDNTAKALDAASIEVYAPLDVDQRVRRDDGSTVSTATFRW